MSNKRIAPMRVTKKATFIIDEVKKINKDPKTQIVEDALSDKFPKYAELYDKGVK